MHPILVFSLIYATGFVLHIVFAMYDLWILFNIDAFLLVVMTYFCGPLMTRKGGTMENFRPGYILSLPLAAGIAYAYTDMVFVPQATLLSLAITTMTHGCWYRFVLLRNDIVAQKGKTNALK